jgi:hypothetical protein
MLVTTSSKIKRERGGGLTGEREKLQNARCPNLQFPLNVNRVLKYTKTKWLIHAGRFGKINAYKIISEKVNVYLPFLMMKVPDHLYV